MPALADSSDAMLLLSWTRQRSDAAMTELVTRYRPTLRRIAARMIDDPEAVEDAVQESFIALANDAASIRDGEPGPWLRSVVTRQALMHLRSRARRRRREVRLLPEAAGPSVQVATCEADDDLVTECVAALHPRDRDLVVRLFWTGETRQTLAREQGVSAVYIHKRFHAVLDRLRRLLSERGRGVTIPALILLLAGGDQALAAELCQQPAGGTPAILPRCGAITLAAAVMTLGLLGVLAGAARAPDGPAGSAMPGSPRQPEPTVGAATRTEGLPASPERDLMVQAASTASQWPDGFWRMDDGHWIAAAMTTDPSGLATQLSFSDRSVFSWRTERILGRDRTVLAVIPPPGRLVMLYRPMLRHAGRPPDRMGAMVLSHGGAWRIWTGTYYASAPGDRAPDRLAETEIILDGDDAGRLVKGRDAATGRQRPNNDWASTAFMFTVAHPMLIAGARTWPIDPDQARAAGASMAASIRQLGAADAGF